jgi:flagellin-like protein
MSRYRTGERSVSPVIGTVLMLAIVVILVAVAGSIIFGTVQEEDPQPNARLTLEPTDKDGVFRLHHESGENITGENTRILGVADEEALHGNSLEAGEEVNLVPVASDVKLVWYGENTDYVLQTFEAEPASLLYDPGNITNECDWVENNIKANGDLDMSNDTGICDVKEDTNTGKDDVNVDLASNSVLVGDIDTDGDVDLDSSEVVGSITSNADDITITGMSTVYGDVVAQSDTNIDIDGDSSVRGDVVVHGGSLSLNNVDIDGHVYADDSDFPGSCPGTTIGPNEETCSEYDPRDPDDH